MQSAPEAASGGFGDFGDFGDLGVVTGTGTGSAEAWGDFPTDAAAANSTHSPGGFADFGSVSGTQEGWGDFPTTQTSHEFEGSAGFADFGGSASVQGQGSAPQMDAFADFSGMQSAVQSAPDDGIPDLLTPSHSTRDRRETLDDLLN